MRKMTDRNLKHELKRCQQQAGNPEVAAVIAKDAVLRTDNLMTRQSFQGRFVKNGRGDRKGRSGLRPEQIDANVENDARISVATAMEEAAAAAGVIVETDVRQPENVVEDANEGL